MMKKFKGLIDLQKVFPTEKSCIKYLEKHRWNGIITSLFDPTSKVYKLGDGWYKCKNTGKRFNVKTGTIFKGTRIPLQTWFWALYNLVNSKKGISSYQLSGDTGITQKSAWHLLKDLRSSLEQSNFIKDIFKNEVEIDETYIGGKNKNRHWDKKVPHSQGRSYRDKIPFLGILEKHSGRIFAKEVSNVERKTLEPIIKKHVEVGSIVNTDEWKSYNKLYNLFKHQVVNHRTNQYTNKDASVNGMENFWSHVKRGITGTHHQISRKHAQGYMDEYVFRHNTRKHSNQERFDLILGSVMSKNLNCQQLIN